mmetsp:Transcript_42614/g.131998  ORF Transcript_42614/g.131998 Transcript_42614/m.131998 type:complete len:374 (+) Transcript_42614:59-1180(+)
MAFTRGAVPWAAVAAAAALLLQGCKVPKPPAKCTQEGYNCIRTGCCMDPSMKCYAKDEDATWASCKSSCTPSFTSSCVEVLHGGKMRQPKTTPPPVETSPEPAGEPERREHPDWLEGTWTTGYWDCCKPSCGWQGKGKVNFPVNSCHGETGELLMDSNEQSVCNGGRAATCPNNQPFVVNDRLSYGFAAAAVSGKNGLVGDKNCGQCFELVFTVRQHVDEGTGDLWGGAHPRLQGKRMVVQVTNIGYDVTGNHSFDILIPGAGQGIFDGGCVAQYPKLAKDDFDCGNRHGGCDNITGCERLPKNLRPGCEWRHQWYKWMEGAGQTNNPYIKFRRVACPAALTDISGSTPEDDSSFPAIVEGQRFRGSDSTIVS